MLRKKNNELNKTTPERNDNKRLIKERPVGVKNRKEATTTPISFAGFPTCFNFLRIPTAEEKNTKQICHLKRQNTQ